VQRQPVPDAVPVYYPDEDAEEPAEEPGSVLGFLLGVSAVMLALYMALGLYLNRMRGKTGARAVPHYEGWAAMPGSLAFWGKVASCWVREVLLLRQWVSPIMVKNRLQYKPLPSVRDSYSNSV
jgi:hypothetical protein